MPVALAVAGIVAAIGGTAASIVAGNQSRAAQRHAADLQEQSQEVQNAQNAQQAADEQRNQYRQERIQRARIEQASVNSGTEGSSGELGSLSSLATQYSANVGSNLGALQRGQQISIFNQQAADTLAAGQSAAATTANIGSIFSAAGSAVRGYATATAKIPGTTGTTPS